MKRIHEDEMSIHEKPKDTRKVVRTNSLNQTTYKYKSEIQKYTTQANQQLIMQDQRGFKRKAGTSSLDKAEEELVTLKNQQYLVQEELNRVNAEIVADTAERFRSDSGGDLFERNEEKTQAYNNALKEMNDLRGKIRSQENKIEALKRLYKKAKISEEVAMNDDKKEDANAPTTTTDRLDDFPQNPETVRKEAEKKFLKDYDDIMSPTSERFGTVENFFKFMVEKSKDKKWTAGGAYLLSETRRKNYVLNFIDFIEKKEPELVKQVCNKI